MSVALHSYVTLTLHNRWRLIVFAPLSLAALFVFGMAVYRDVDVSLYSDLPTSVQSLLGLPAGADVAALSYNAILSAYGALVLGAIAISLGSKAIAGQERAGRLGLLLANPVSRTRLMTDSIVVLLSVFVVIGILLVAVGLVAPALLSVSISGLAVPAFVLQLTLGTVLYGFIALALGAWTGKVHVATGVSAAVMTVSFFAAGLLPMINGVENLARGFPWYYISAGDPLNNGTDPGALVVMTIAITILISLAYLGINRRDLRQRSASVSVVDQLRAHPLTAQLVGRLMGRTVASRLWIKTVTEFQGITLVVAFLMFSLMGLAMGPIYSFVQPSMAPLADTLPEGLLALFGGGDLSTPQGFFQLETFGLVAPLAIMAVTISVGAKAIAGEEANATMGLLLANPISRGRVITQKLVAMAILGFVVAAATFLGVAGANLVSDLGMDPLSILAMCVNLLLLGYLFGAIALLAGSASGRVSVAITVAVVLAVMSQVFNGLASISGAWWGNITPTSWYLGTDPLNTGFDALSLLILSATTLLLVGASYPAFQRRDLRQG